MASPSRFKEVGIVAVAEIIVISILLALFASFGAFDYTAVLGALLSAFGNLICVFTLCLSVDNAINAEDVAKGQRSIVISKYIRLAIMAVVLIIGLKLPYFNNIALIPPLLVTRPALSLHAMIFSKEGKK